MPGSAGALTLIFAKSSHLRCSAITTGTKADFWRTSSSTRSRARGEISMIWASRSSTASGSPACSRIITTRKFCWLIARLLLVRSKICPRVGAMRRMLMRFSSASQAVVLALDDLELAHPPGERAGHQQLRPQHHEPAARHARALGRRIAPLRAEAKAHAAAPLPAPAHRGSPCPRASRWGRMPNTQPQRKTVSG